MFALACLVLAKIANVGIPMLLKQIVDNLDQAQELLVVPVALLLGYGALRLSSSLSMSCVMWSSPVSVIMRCGACRPGAGASAQPHCAFTWNAAPAPSAAIWNVAPAV